MKTGIIDFGPNQNKRYFEFDVQELMEILLDIAKKSGSGCESMSVEDFVLDCEVVGHWNYLQNVTLIPKDPE